MNHLIHSKKVISEIAKINTPIGVFMSFGKDSLVTTDLICKFGKPKKLALCYKYLVRGLEHIEIKKSEVLDYFILKYPEIEFVYYELPEPDVIKALKLGIFCDPVTSLKRVKIPKWKDMEEELREETGADYVAWGVKQQDSLDRMVTLQTYREQAIYDKAKRFFPVAKWTHKQINSYIKTQKLPDPIKYGLGNMNGIGLNAYTQNWLASNHPNDLQKVRNVFPYFYI